MIFSSDFPYYPTLRQLEEWGRWISLEREIPQTFLVLQYELQTLLERSLDVEAYVRLIDDALSRKPCDRWYDRLVWLRGTILSEAENLQDSQES